jgi:hypothetical protein
MTLLADMPDIPLVLIWGFVATMIMTIILYGSQVSGLSRLSLPFLLGTCLTSNRDHAHVVGFVVYMIGGWIFAFIYAAFFSAIGPTWWVGAVAGAVHGLFLLLVVLPTLPHFHPRMASEYEGPNETGQLEPPGFLGLNYGYRTPLTTLVAQTSYGLVLGAFLPG